MWKHISSAELPVVLKQWTATALNRTGALAHTNKPKCQIIFNGLRDDTPLTPDFHFTPGRYIYAFFVYFILGGGGHGDVMTTAPDDDDRSGCGLEYASHHHRIPLHAMADSCVDDLNL